MLRGSVTAPVRTPRPGAVFREVGWNGIALLGGSVLAQGTGDAQGVGKAPGGGADPFLPVEKGQELLQSTGGRD